MKTEYREVLVKQPVYIAEDGTEFEDEDECCDYEFKCAEKAFTYYDRSFQQTNDIYACFYIDLATDVEVKAFRHICDVYDIFAKGLDKPGAYAYIDRDDRWFNMTEAIAKIRGGATGDQN